MPDMDLSRFEGSDRPSKGGCRSAGDPSRVQLFSRDRKPLGAFEPVPFGAMPGPFQRDGKGQGVTGQIILLHGPSSSGKSTTAAALRRAIDRPFWHISIDHLRDAGVLPDDRLKSGDFLWSHMRKPFFDGFHRSLPAYAGAGNNLIVEHILDTPGWADDLKTLLAPFDVFFVGVRCSLAVLQRRERTRGDRPPRQCRTGLLQGA